MISKYFTLSLAAFFLAFSSLTQNPFNEIGKSDEVKIVTLSNGRYVEFFENDTLRQIGSVIFNTVTNDIEYIIPEDDLEKIRIAKRDKEVSRFMAVDPLAPQYPHNSPYAFSENIVINAVELEGLEKSLSIFGDASNFGKGSIIIMEDKDIYKQAYEQAIESGFDIMFIQMIADKPDENGVYPGYGLEYSDYYKYINEYTNEHDVEIGILVYFSHANKDGLPQKTYTENNKRTKSYINSQLIRSMMSKVETGDKLTSEEQGAKYFIDALKKVKTGGDIVIGACLIGHDEDLGSAIYDAVGKDINIYLNIDKTAVIPNKVVNKGMTEYLNYGWTLTNSSGTKKLNSTIKFNENGVELAEPIKGGTTIPTDE